VIAGGALLALLTVEAAPVVPLAPLAPLSSDPAALAEGSDDARFTDETQPRLAHPYLRTAIEEVVLLGLGTAWYWRHPSYSSWDLHFTWTDWHSKLFSMRQVVFDDDLFTTNGLSHPIAGTIYYQVARGNGLSPLASFVTSFLASTAWEYFSEWDEKPSTNDLIFTPAGGAVIGEAAYRLGRTFAAGTPGVGNCLGALLFSPVATLNQAPVCRGVTGQPTDAFGLPTRVSHRLTFELGQTYSSFDGGSLVTSLEIGLAAAIVDHRRYQKPGTGLTSIRPGDWTELAFDGMFSHDGTRGLELHANGVWWGRYFRSYALPDEHAPRPPDGWGMMLGLGSTFDYDGRLLPTEWDRVVTAGLGGPMLEYTDRCGSLTTRAAFNVQYGFSMVSSLAYPAAAAALADATIKTELKHGGYYYAQSVTGAATVSLDDGPIGVFVRARVGGYWSFNRDDRYQAELTDNFSLHDERLWLRAAASTRVLGGPLRLALVLDQINRESHLPGYAYDGVERRVAVLAVAAF
jgi:hypothetical protein